MIASSAEGREYTPAHADCGLVVLLAAALTAAESQTKPFAVGVLRRDGMIVPFAAFDGRHWSRTGRAGVELTVPIDLRSVPSSWWGPTGPLDTWDAWLGKRLSSRRVR